MTTRIGVGRHRPAQAAARSATAVLLSLGLIVAGWAVPITTVIVLATLNLR